MPQSPGPARRARRAQRRSAHRLRRFAGLTAVAAVGVVTLLVTAFGPDAAESAARSAPAPADRLLPSGPPEPLVVATQGALRVQLPIEQNRVTAIGYHGGRRARSRCTRSADAANQGLIGRFSDRVFGSGDSSMTWYQLQGGTVRRRPRSPSAQRRTPTSTRRSTERSRDHRLRPQRPDARQADRHPAHRAPVTHRLDHAARSRPCADGRLVRRGGATRSSAKCSTSRGSSGRRSRATRRTPATT